GADGAVSTAVRAGGVRGATAGEPVAVQGRELPARAAEPARVWGAVATDSALLEAGLGGAEVLLELPGQGGEAVAATGGTDGDLHGDVHALHEGARAGIVVGPVAAADDEAEDGAGRQGGASGARGAGAVIGR